VSYGFCNDVEFKSSATKDLKWLIKCVRFAEQHNPSLLETGFAWGINIQDKAGENSRRASLCRALSRLERRGLLIRIRGRKRVRTARVKLTAEGQHVAEASSVKMPPY
jgi:hypothetical protein